MRHTDGVFIPGSDRSDDNYIRIMKVLFFFHLFTVFRYHRFISRQSTVKNRIRDLEKLVAGE